MDTAWLLLLVRMSQITYQLAMTISSPLSITVELRNFGLKGIQGLDNSDGGQSKGAHLQSNALGFERRNTLLLCQIELIVICTLTSTCDIHARASR